MSNLCCPESLKGALQTDIRNLDCAKGDLQTDIRNLDCAKGDLQTDIRNLDSDPYKLTSGIWTAKRLELAHSSPDPGLAPDYKNKNIKGYLRDFICPHLKLALP
ncbi:hypothetical protein RLOC_00012211 [Lonchura striata]|uniref:Uncharacterized protein n=1 Tax=Lonchura striata TaxID=40157 RepID=A0A218UD10_9PASE|nr:hypothetical protein RLOC_00012211 [Lonchura striata domestica]